MSAKKENSHGSDISEHEFMASIEAENVQLIEQALAAGMRVDRAILYDGELATPMHLACVVGNDQIAQMLFDTPACDVNCQLSTGETPLYVASQRGDQNLVDALIKARANVGLSEIDGNTPLYAASENGHHRVVRSLIKAGADVDVQGCDGCTSLYIASQNGHNPVVKMLIEAQADLNLQSFEGATPLYIASQFGEHEVVDSLIRAQADVDILEISGCSPLYISSRQGHSKVVDFLIKAQADVHHELRSGISSLMAAALQGHNKVVDSLIKGGAVIDLQLIEGSSALHAASETGHVRVADSLIQADAKVDLQNDHGATAIYVAAQNGHFEVVDRLIKAKADVNLQKHDKMSPLCIASIQGHFRVVQRLLRCPKTNVDIQAAKGTSALFAASQYGHDRVVKMLVNAQIDVNQPDDYKCTPLHIASQNGHHLVVKFLIRAQAEVDATDKDGASPLYYASQNGHERVVSLLIKAQADVNLSTNSGGSPLSIASEQNHFKVVQLLIKAQSDVNLQRETGSSPLYLACQNGHHQVARSLLKAEADVDLPNSVGASPLYIASQDGHHAAVSLLIKAGAHVNTQCDDGMSPLYVASLNNHLPVVKSLIKAHANVNIREDVFGTTPLYIASQNGHYQIAETLIKAKADIDCQGENGMTPLYIAALSDHIQIVDLLIKAQAVVDLSSSDNCTPLFAACFQGHSKVVSLLVRAMADVNIVKSDGCTPVFIAAQNGHNQVVDLLIKAQADLNCRCIEGCTPTFAASLNGHHKVVDSLIQAQADVSIPRMDGLTPLKAASLLKHHQVVTLLTLAEYHFEELELYWTEVELDDDSGSSAMDATDQEVPSTETELGEQLHAALSRSGFVASRAALQAAAADVLQEILRNRIAYEDIFVVGSFSEGWGNSLTSLDGKTDIESDIDVMELVRGRLYHLKHHCSCKERNLHPVEYTNGHILCSGFATNPAKPFRGSSLKPAVDIVAACRLYCYPPIAPLLPSRRSASNIAHSILQSLESELTNSPCHVVHAAPPKKSGKQLRVSTTFLEKRLLRSLSTLQGQLFVTLKYLVKKVICRRVQGVKAYHVKTITFRMLEETPSDQWKPENLVSQIRRSLQILSSSVKSSCSEDEAATKPEDKIMNHFFLCDAALYLKGADKSSSQEISRVLQYVMKRLPELLIKFIHTLRPLTNTGTFHFHPFLILPRMKANKVRMSATVEYHEIYDFVRESLVRLSQRDCSSPELKQSLLQHISQLPDCARTARETLKALAFLKFRDRDAALKVLADCRGHIVSEGISWRSERSAAEATKDLMWHYLWSNDSAWKFCFEFDQRPELEFLPAVLSDCFPLRLQNYVTYHYVNFDAFLHSLRLELTPQDEDAHRWVNTVALRVGADIQELVVGASFYREAKLLIEPWRDLQAALTVIPRRLADEVAQRLKVFDRGEQEMSSDSADATLMHVHVL